MASCQGACGAGRQLAELESWLRREIEKMDREVERAQTRQHIEGSGRYMAALIHVLSRLQIIKIGGIDVQRG